MQVRGTNARTGQSAWARLLGMCALVSVASACADSATGQDADARVNDVNMAEVRVEFNPTGVETVAPMTVRAGDVLNVSCLLTDDAGQSNQPPAGLTPTILFSPSDSIARNASGQTIATRAGTVEARCTFPTLSLTDDTPSRITVTPGPAAALRTTLDRTQITAGGSVTATCETFDAYGNRITNAMPTLTSTPMDPGNMITGLSGMFTRSGIYQLACTLPGVNGNAVQMEVLPGLPAAISISRVPEQPVYAVGSVIEIAVVVTDQYGNVVRDAPLTYASAPAAMEMFGDGRFRYTAEGNYTVTVRVTGMTQNNMPLSATTTIEIGGQGPAINCDSPTNGSMINLAPGGTVAFRGSVSDANGVMSVRVNNAAATLTNGVFTANLTTRFGINFVDIQATDRNGAMNSKTCSFLVSDQWANPANLYNDTVSLKLMPAAFDDGNPNDGLDSLADILRTVLNSTGLRDTIHNALLAANPLKPEACDQQVCAFGGCVCLFRSGVTYLDLSIGGPNDVTLTPVNGGFQANITLRDFAVRLRITGTISNTGWIRVQRATVNPIFDVALVNGRPRVTIRPGTVNTQITGLSADFSGLTGVIADIVLALGQGIITNILETQINNYAQNNLNQVLDSVISNLDVNSLGSTFNVPKLDGSGNIPVTFGVGFSSISATASRMLFGISTRFGAPTAQSRPSLGAAVPPGAVLADPTVNAPSTTAAAIHVALFNQVLHALWRGGMFDATITGATISGFPAGASVRITSLLPPVANMAPYNSTSPTGAEISLGAMQIELVYPGLFDATMPLRADLGARATATVTLNGNDLRFGGLTLSEFKFSTGDVSLPMSTRTTLENFLRAVLQRVVDSALNNALPAIPIPAFTLPASLSQYGLPTGGRLGVTTPALTPEPRHFVLRGGFGIN